jgi:hypothetical protein
MPNFKSAAKRKRELAKLDKRQAKEQKRAVRRAERSAVVMSAATPTSAILAQPAFAKQQPPAGPAPVRRPTTLAEAVELWKNTRIGKPRKR